jgi:hypothetical protein
MLASNGRVACLSQLGHNSRASSSRLRYQQPSGRLAFHNAHFACMSPSHQLVLLHNCCVQHLPCRAQLLPLCALPDCCPQPVGCSCAQVMQTACQQTSSGHSSPVRFDSCGMAGSSASCTQLGTYPRCRPPHCGPMQDGHVVTIHYRYEDGWWCNCMRTAPNGAAGHAADAEECTWPGVAERDSVLATRTGLLDGLMVDLFILGGPAWLPGVGWGQHGGARWEVDGCVPSG